MVNYQSPTDLLVRQLPAAIPAMGPAGSIVTDPAFGTKIIRATDEKTSQIWAGPATLSAGIGGSADTNTWNTDSTMLAVGNSGGQVVLLGFDPVLLTIKRIFPNLKAQAVIFSKVNPNVGFGFVGTQFLQYDFSDRTLAAPPAPIVICDFAKQLPEAVTWSTVGGVENQDTIFSAAFSTTGSQGTGVYACVYTIGKGYRTWNTESGEVAGDWGPVGMVNCSDRFLIHNLKPNKGVSKYAVISCAAMVSTDVAMYIWEHATLDVRPMGGVGKAYGGHFCAGYGKLFNHDGSPNIPQGAYVQRCLCDLEDPSRLSNPSPAINPGDNHFSLNGPNCGVLIATGCNVRAVGTVKPPFAAAWTDEVIGLDLSGSGKVWRFCHTFCSGNSGNFYADNAIGCGDQQNKFVAFTSDWMQTLAKSRSDVFIVELR